MNSQPLSAALAPPAFLQLAGHPLRWRLLSELARSDRLVHELTDLVGEAQNLVSYHLAKLRDARLVSARRSAADRRDTYYGLDLADHSPRRLDDLAGQQFDWVISLCDRVREVCPEFPGGPETIHWSIANPATGEPDDVTYPLFQATAAELASRIDFLFAALAHRAPAQEDPRRPP